MRPKTLNGDRNRLFSKFPDAYDEFARVEHSAANRAGATPPQPRGQCCQ